MSQINELMIQGIRSFDPQKIERIKFSNVTVIVGHNGAGKTTIVECLRFCTTGQYPPGSKPNAAFIYDTQLANETTVKAQVKLQFTNVNGDSVCCTRILQATQKAESKSMKTVDQALKIRDPVTDNEYSISSKCAQIDEEMPNHLGVSSAILNSVIFCHQQDSFWPLGDPATLKKNFDDIFASTRYSKALASLKDLRKTKQVDLRVLEKELQHTKSDYDKSKALARKKDELEKDIAKVKDQIQKLDQVELRQSEEAVNAANNAYIQVSSLQVKKEHVLLERDMLGRNLATLKENLEIFQDEELQELIQQHNNSLNTHGDDQKTLETEKIRINESISGFNEKMSELFSQKGNLEALNNQLLKLKQERQEIAYQISASRNYNFNSRQLDETQIQLISDRIRRESEEQQRVVAEKKYDMKARENELSQKVQIHTLENAQLLEKQSMISSQISQLTSKIQHLVEKKNRLGQQQDEMDDLLSNLEFEKNSLAHLRETSKLTEIEGKISSLGRKLQERESYAQNVQYEMSSLTLQADTRAKLSLKKNELSRKNDAYNRLSVVLKAEWIGHLGEFNPDRLEIDIKTAIAAKQNCIKNVRATFQEKLNRVSVLDANVKYTRDELEKKQKELDNKLEQIRNVVGDEDYVTARSMAETRADQERENVLSMKSAGTMYRKFIAKFKETRVPIVQREALEQLSIAEKERNELRELSSVWDDCERLQMTDIPSLRQQRERYEKERANSSAKLEDSESELALLDVELNSLQSISVKVDEFTRLQKEIKTMEKDVATITKDLSSSGSFKTMDQISSEYESAQSECKLLRKEIDSLASESRLKQKEIQTKDDKVRALTDQHSALVVQLAELEAIGNSIKEQTNELQKLQSSLPQLQADLEQTSIKIRSSTLELEGYQEEMAILEEQLRQENAQLDQALFSINNMNQQIQEISVERPDTKLNQVSLEINKVKKQMTDAENNLETVSKRLDQMSKLKSQVQLIQRSLDDNLKVRQLTRELDNCNGQLLDIESKINQLNASELLSQVKRAQEHFSEMQALRSNLLGRLNEMLSQSEGLGDTLRKDYGTSHIAYKKAKISHMTDTMALEDMELFSKKLEQAIVQYHDTKMVELNRIIRELWIKTYKGNDIDYITIKAENPKDERRNITYKVLLVRNDIEIDMRGRCSAGQKVLASIIIRLALAETFCINCGMLALDEPTTNLDQENIKSLAHSLVSIIEARRVQNNFQIIIITHDEDFLQILGHENLFDEYYRVTKNEQGKSTILLEKL